jgi:hypothetical protein
MAVIFTLRVPHDGISSDYCKVKELCISKYLLCFITLPVNIVLTQILNVLLLITAVLIKF